MGCLALLPALWVQSAAAQAVKPEGSHTSHELISNVGSVQPGTPFTLGLRITPDKGWKTYWAYGGDSHMEAERFGVTVPEGWKVGPIQWPSPTRFMMYEGTEYAQVGYGYKKGHTLLRTITPPASASAGTSVDIGVEAEWLECDAENCVPGDVKTSLSLPIKKSAATEGAGNAAIEATRKKLSSASGEWKSTAWRTATDLHILATPPAGTKVATAMFIPETQELTNLKDIGTWKEVQGGYEMKVGLSDFDAAKTIKRVKGILLAEDGASYQIDTAIESKAPDAKELAPPGSGKTDNKPDSKIGNQTDGKISTLPNSQSGNLPNSQTGSTTDASAVAALGSTAGKPDSVASLKAADTTALGETGPNPMSFPKAALFMFLGGVILNLMPCVFPVIGLKIMGFVEQAKEGHGSPMSHALVYTLGILVTMWIVAAFVIIFKMAWGSWLGDPRMNIALVTLFFLMGLSFFGVFEMGQGLTGVGGGLQSKSGYLGSFFTGVLAIIVASPCMAPGMASAVPMAIQQPPVLAFLLFSLLGLGLATPYLILSSSPKLMKLIPRPGNWMITFKHLVGFAMMAVAIWQLTILGENGIFRMLIALLVIAFFAWMYGRYAGLTASKGQRLLATLVALAGVAVTTGFQFSKVSLGDDTPPPSALADTAVSNGNWAPYSPEAVAQARAEGYGVFIDWTATWCVTCKANKPAMRSDEVTKAFQDKGIKTFTADFTRSPKWMKQELEKLGRIGVPAYPLYSSDLSAKPTILPNILTKNILIEAAKNL